MFNPSPSPFAFPRRHEWLLAGALALCANPAAAFCGFYVAQADTKIYNQASKVVLVRDGDKTVLTISSDFTGAPSEFAMVVPVPVVLAKDQIRAGEQAPIDHLDAYSAPRLVEYHDENPCEARRYMLMDMAAGARAKSAAAPLPREERDHGVTIEASYTVGEYDILILSAKESNGLILWLRENKYTIPDGADAVVGSYLRQGMKFFVAKVNLKQQRALGFSNLRPLQMAFESPKFMLPIRLGTVNAKGTQELFVFAITRKGRVEPVNYRVQPLPTGQNVPLFVREDFKNFYKTLYDRQWEKSGGVTLFTEYAWDMTWCDPCAAPPLDPGELQKLGVFWLDEPDRAVFLTRLHARYDRARYPEDFVFHETGDRANFQGRYVLNHPWTGSEQCPQLAQYRETLRNRQQEEQRNLAGLTGWQPAAIRARMNALEPVPPRATPQKTWWQKLWGK